MTASEPQVRTSFRFRGRLDALQPDERRELFDRSSSPDPEIIIAVSEIIRRVREEGDDALLEYATRFDCVNLSRLELPRSVIDAARGTIGSQLEASILRAAHNIDRVHRAFAPCITQIESEPGVTVMRRPDPLDAVGIYAPGGKAAYASSVLMAAVPARVAGVREIVLCSPPQSDGLPSREVLAAASIAGVDRVFAIGGAGAIAAMAFGTGSVPRTNKIVGPGNAFVAEAKLQCSREVPIDCPAGPSELVIIADSSASPDVIAREVMAQAEHDVRAIVIVIAIGDDVALKIECAIESRTRSEPRREVIDEALANRGRVLVADSIDEAVRASNAFAPEHLLIATRNAESIVDMVRSAGTVFVGETSSVAFGDYMTGANHVLPTGGMAQSYSGLSTLDFVRWTTIQRITVDAAARLALDTARFADAEGLSAHASAARSWGAQ
ncbi:MAG TPA: histidinol dehydrogenase [Gemmatimonadaceae bacterium]